MSAHYFVSDAHIGAGPAGAEERLLSFLESIQGRADSLYIIGDLFDFWFESDRAVPEYGFRTMAEISRLHRAGTRITCLAGNHDFRFQQFFSREVGARRADIVEEVIDNRRVWMSHGDHVDQRLISVLFRRLMRSRAGEVAYSLVPCDMRMELAGWAARISRAREQDEYLREELARFAAGKLAQGFDLVVMGHLHIPELRRIEHGLYLNTGDWLTHFSYGMIKDGVVSLEYFRE